MKVRIKGPVLLLMGPLGSFFSRFADYLLANNVRIHKVMFPLREFFPRKKHMTHYYDRPMSEWRSYLSDMIARHGIKHLFMYGDFPKPHKIAIELANELGVEAWIFELGYIRPQHVTLERNRVNARSNLNKPVAFYHALPKVQQSPATPLVQLSDPWLKLWRVPYFIQHAFADFEIVEGPHKLKPTPSYLYYQFLGYITEPWYAFSERRVRARIREVPNLFLAVLQVSIDSQVTMESKYK